MFKLSTHELALLREVVAAELTTTRLDKDTKKEMEQEIQRGKAEQKQQLTSEGYSITFTWQPSGDAEELDEEFRTYDDFTKKWVAKQYQGAIWVPPTPPHAISTNDALPSLWAKKIKELLPQNKEVRDAGIAAIQRAIEKFYPEENVSIVNDMPDGRILATPTYEPLVVPGDLRGEIDAYPIITRTRKPSQKISPSQSKNPSQKLTPEQIRQKMMEM